MQRAGSAHLRVARPSRDLAAAERFWCGGLGLEVLARIEPTGVGEHRLLMLGDPGAAWHLELVEQRDSPSDPASVQDQLVLYLDGDVAGHLERVERAGGRRTAASNPYWDRWGTTVVDPDGYRLVLSTQAWPG